MADNSKSAYIGKIANGATQNIKAPVQQHHEPKKGTVKTGKDLRAGKK